MVHIDNLQFRKNKVRQPMQYAWCAATTRNFLGTNAEKITKKEIDDLDIGSLCEDIISEMSDSQDGMRSTLYMLSMLSSGAVKLFQQQTNSLLDDSQKLMVELLGGTDVASQKKKKKAKGKKIEEVHLEEPVDLNDLSIHSIPQIDIAKVLGKKNTEDCHLLSEMDFIQIPEIPQSFGFNPNERELTEQELQALFNDMTSQDPVQMIPEHMPQDNHLFEMNNAPMPPPEAEMPPVNAFEKQPTPQGSPQKHLELLRTPKKYLSRSKKSIPQYDSPSEAAKTAFSPDKKRKRTIYQPQEGDNADDMMVGMEPPMEAAFPHDLPREAEAAASPVFDIRKRSRRHNITLPLHQKNLEELAEKGAPVAEAEPLVDDRMEPELPPQIDPVTDQQMDLPNVSIFDPPPATDQPEVQVPAQSQNQSFHASPTAAPQPDANASAHGSLRLSSKLSLDLSLDAINSFEEKSRKKYIRRGKKIFADRIKQVEIEARPANFMTMSREEVLFPHVTRLQSTLSLFKQPATLKDQKYLPMNRWWSDDLLKRRRERLLAQPAQIEIQRTKKKKRARSPENSQHSNEQNKEEREPSLPKDAEMNVEQIIQEPREPSPPQHIEVNVEQVVNVPEQREDLIPEDNQMDVDPNANVPPVDVQSQKPDSPNVIHDVAQEFQQPPFDEPPAEEYRAPVDQIEVAMSPPKRFKSKDDEDLEDGEERSNEHLTPERLLEIIKSYWNKAKKRDIDQHKCVRVKYDKVIKPRLYNGVEAARYLQHCFILENKKKLYLEQEEPYDAIYLIKWQSAVYVRG